MLPIKLFKFKPVTYFEYVLDIIENQRLYCADFRSLNDVREGVMTMGDSEQKGIMSFYQEYLHSELEKLKVCSLTTELHSHLMWAHYADGYRGVSIEVEVDNCDLAMVKYPDTEINFSELGSHVDIRASAKQVLSSKSKVWEYEKEYRLIQEETLFKLKYPVKRVIVGTRANELIINVLKDVCSRKKIRLERIFINNGAFGTKLV